jgi:quercetin dioxygenase-like cupin family protein
MPFGDNIRWITGEEATGGAFSLLERVAPPGARSAPHTHRRLEAFYVLDGEFDFVIDGSESRGGAGAFVSAPEGVSHGWSVRGEAPARMLLLFAPSTPLAYYVELDALLRAADGRARPEAIVELSRRHGIL